MGCIFSKHLCLSVFFPSLCIISLAVVNPECNSATWSRYDGSCCTAQNPCGIGEGDCDRSDQCLGDLVCGKDNCGSGFPPVADCCRGNLNISLFILCFVFLFHPFVIIRGFYNYFYHTYRMRVRLPMPIRKDMQR